MYVKLMRQKYT